MQIIVLQTFAVIQAIHDSCHWSITGIEFAKKILTCKALFPWFPILLKGLKGSISPSWFQELKHATYFFLNKTWSLSLNLKPHGILLNKKYKNLPLSLNTAMWLGWSFYAPRSRSTSVTMPWFNSKRWAVRESTYAHPSNSSKCMAWSMCSPVINPCSPKRIQKIQLKYLHVTCMCHPT